jgi:hypothetical protein
MNILDMPGSCECRNETLGFYERRVITCPAERLLAFQGLCLPSWLVTNLGV